MEYNEELLKKSKYEDIGKIIEISKKLETFLQINYEAEGKGLHEKITSVENKLLKDLISVRILRKIATIRNKVVHDDNFEQENMIEEVEKLFNIVLMELETIKKNKEELILKEEIKEVHISNKEIDNDYSKPIKVLVIIVIILLVYFFMFRSENSEIIKKNINDINSKISFEEEKLNKLNYKLKDEQEKQGKIRTFFYDNDNVDNLEKEIKNQIKNLENLNSELENQKTKL